MTVFYVFFRATITAVNVFLDALQRIADLATNAKGKPARLFPICIAGLFCLIDVPGACFLPNTRMGLVGFFFVGDKNYCRLLTLAILSLTLLVQWQ